MNKIKIGNIYFIIIANICLLLGIIYDCDDWKIVLAASIVIIAGQTILIVYEFSKLLNR